MILRDALRQMSLDQLRELYRTLYHPEEMPALTETELCQQIESFWDNPAHWEELIAALSPTERRAMIRLALQERCQIDAFLEEMSALGLVVLYRDHNRYQLPDDVRYKLLERLPSIGDLLSAKRQGDEDGIAPV